MFKVSEEPMPSAEELWHYRAAQGQGVRAIVGQVRHSCRRCHGSCVATAATHGTLDVAHRRSWRPAVAASEPARTASQATFAVLSHEALQITRLPNLHA